MLLIQMCMQLLYVVTLPCKSACNKYRLVRSGRYSIQGGGESFSFSELGLRCLFATVFVVGCA